MTSDHHPWWLAGLAGAAVSVVWNYANYAVSSVFTCSPHHRRPAETMFLDATHVDAHGLVGDVNGYPATRPKIGVESARASAVPAGPIDHNLPIVADLTYSEMVNSQVARGPR